MIASSFDMCFILIYVKTTHGLHAWFCFVFMLFVGQCRCVMVWAALDNEQGAHQSGHGLGDEGAVVQHGGGQVFAGNIAGLDLI